MPTVTIGKNTGNTFSGFADTRIDSYAPTFAYGEHYRSYSGKNPAGDREMRELQRWILSDIAAGMSCISAILYLYDTDWSNRSADCTLNLYQIASDNGEWIENSGSDSAITGAPCWNYEKYNTDAWAGSNGLLTAGIDYINTLLGSGSFTDGVSGYRAITLNAAGRAVLESWFGAASNPGILVIGSGSNGCWTEWASSQGTDGQRPYLSIEYGASSSSWQQKGGLWLRRNEGGYE